MSLGHCLQDCLYKWQNSHLTPCCHSLRTPSWPCQIITIYCLLGVSLVVLLACCHSSSDPALSIWDCGAVKLEIEGQISELWHIYHLKFPIWLRSQFTLRHLYNISWFGHETAGLVEFVWLWSLKSIFVILQTPGPDIASHDPRPCSSPLLEINSSPPQNCIRSSSCFVNNEILQELFCNEHFKSIWSNCSFCSLTEILNSFP